MKSSAIVGFISLLFITSITCALIPAVFYDSEKQAIGVNPYFDGYGNYIYVDFNADHSSGAMLMQHATENTDPAVYKYFDDERPWINYKVSYSYCIDENNIPISFWESQTAEDLTLDIIKEDWDKVRFFVDEWNFSESLTTIYLQSINDYGAAVPVLVSDLQNIYYQISPHSDPFINNDWHSLPVPEPATLSLLALGAFLAGRKRK